MRSFLYKRKIIYIILIVMGIVTLTGTTYAIFTITTTQEGTNTINTLKCLELTFSNQSDAINLDNTYPMSDERGSKNTPYTFTLTNKCGAYIGYSLGLAINNDNTLDDKYVKTMVSLKEKVGTPALLTDKTVGQTYNGKKTYIMRNDSLANGESKDYKLTLWIDGSLTNSQMNKSFKGNIILQLKPIKEPAIIECDDDNAITIKNVSSQSDAVFTKNCKVVVDTSYVSEDEVLIYKIKMKNHNNTYDGLGLSYSLGGTNTSNKGIMVPNINKEYIGTSDVYLGEGIVENGLQVEHDYNLKIFLNDIGLLASDVQASKFDGELAVEYSTAPKEPTGWSDAKSGTLLAGIKTNNSKYAQLLTSPGKETTTSTEAVLGATIDDYGISYYYRGNVTNNFVAFAGMCWRIVRINGDGSIKLTLYNYSSDDCTKTGTTLALARYSTNNYYTSKYNAELNDNAYVGFMYGDLNSSSYNSMFSNTNKSTILQNLESWYDNNIKNYENKLADTIWCNDKSYINDYNILVASVDSTTNKLTSKITNFPGLTSATAMILYSGRDRLRTNYFFTGSSGGQYGTSGIGPTLKCPNDNNNGNLSKYTVDNTDMGNGAISYKIGLLTADELIYAGTVDYHVYMALNYGADAINYYLKTNTENQWFWTLTPASYSSGAYVWRQTGYGYVTLSAVNNAGGIRPTISLKTDTMLMGGDGSAAAPFLVN